MAEASGREWSSDIKDIGDKIMALTLFKAQELGDYLKDVYGIEAAAAAVMAAGPAVAAGGAAPAAEAEKEDFTVVLTGAGDKKIQVIKVVREITSCGLAEGKAMVEGAPKAIKENVSKEEAETIKKKLEDAGAKVELK